MNTNNSALAGCHLKFSEVVGCVKCSSANNLKLLRDGGENVPQPGYIGTGYERTRLLLVGQNPAVPGTLEPKDRGYTAALRALRDEKIQPRYEELQKILVSFIPMWPFAQHFRLKEFDLTLDDIAFFNLVRCRTKGTPPDNNIAATCRRTHFEPWLDWLEPAVVVFIGKWAYEQGGGGIACNVKRIPCVFINLQRSLSRHEREKNLAAVAAVVRQHIRPKAPVA